RRRSTGRRGNGSRRRDDGAAAERDDGAASPVVPRAAVPAAASASPRAAAPAGGATNGVELLIGAGRERRLLERVAQAPSALVIVPDVETAARWAQRLGRGRPVLRLDSGVDDAGRADAWTRLAAGGVAVGTRSALLAP